MDWRWVATQIPDASIYLIALTRRRILTLGQVYPLVIEWRVCDRMDTRYWRTNWSMRCFLSMLIVYCSGQIGALQSTNPTRECSSHLFNDMGEIKKINWVAGSCISKVNSQPLNDKRRAFPSNFFFFFEMDSKCIWVFSVVDYLLLKYNFQLLHIRVNRSKQIRFRRNNRLPVRNNRLSTWKENNAWTSLFLSI